MSFDLSVCAEMLWLDRPIQWRCERIREMGFKVGLWNWFEHDLNSLAKSGAHFSILNGYVQGCLIDEGGSLALLESARLTCEALERLKVDKLNFHGTGLDPLGVPILKYDHLTSDMWTKARDTLHRLCDLADEFELTFTLENLNRVEHPGCPFSSAGDTLSLVSSVNRPSLRLNLDLYHVQYGEGDLFRTCASCVDWLAEVQVADNPGRCEPGTGEVNFDGVSRRLKELGYEGAVGLEAFAKSDDVSAISAFAKAFR